uniref:Uncharacterized protein n=1 Tax=Globisporangium ultimum (strain ATCC 200006 / CBS 805.95 / DAOM BR144) TaxID=431595 RepID=K3WFJ0_GLOUD
MDAVPDRELIRHLLRPQRVWLWLGGTLFMGIALMAFAPELKVGVSKHTADVASKSLQDETLQGHTRELASQIVQTVLNDPKVLDQASQFLQRLVVMDTTRDALRGLIIHTLNDPVTLKHVSNLAKHTVSLLLEDANMRHQVVDLLRATVLDPKAKESILLLIDQLMKDEQTRRNLAQLLAHTFVQDPVKQNVTRTLGESVHDVLSRADIQNHAKHFVGNVVKDQTVQAQSGDAIWSTVVYAITPGWLSWIWRNDTAGTEAGSKTSIDKVVILESEAAASKDGKSSKKTVDDVVIVTRDVPSATTAGKEGETEEKNKSRIKRTPTKQPQRSMPRRQTSKNPTEGSKSDPSASKEFSEEYERRHWNGTGSGFL